ETLLQILFLRGILRGAQCRTDRFVAALCLGHLHGESDRSSSFFSNQMSHTIAMKPAYAVRYWQQHGLTAPERDVFKILKDKAQFRLEGGCARRAGIVRRGDARNVARIFKDSRGQVSAVITSPPYLDVTNFEEDQWLRLWFL